MALQIVQRLCSGMFPSIADVISKRLDDLNRSPAEAAREAKKNYAFINDLLIGKKRSVRGDNMGALAKAMSWSVDELAAAMSGKDLTEINRPDSFNQKSTQRIDFDAHSHEAPRIVGKVAAGVWRTPEAMGDAMISIRDPFPVDPRFPASDQFDLLVEGTSIDRIATDGALIRCLRIDSRDPRDGDLVIVEADDGAGKIETTVKQLRTRNGVVELWPYSTDPKWQTPIRVEPGSRTVRIIATVLYAYRVPELSRARD